MHQVTSHNVIEKDLQGYDKISDEHVENNRAVRKILNERGVQPGRKPPAEDVKKVQRELQSDERSVAKQVKKNNKKK